MMTIPHEIARKIVMNQVHPVTAWRQYFRMSKSMLANYLQLREDEITKIESSNQHLQPANLKKLSDAFGIYPEALNIRYNSFN